MAEFEVEWKELGNLIEEDKKMRDKMKEKLQEAQSKMKFEGTEHMEDTQNFQEQNLNNYGYGKVSRCSICTWCKQVWL